MYRMKYIIDLNHINQVLIYISMKVADIARSALIHHIKKGGSLLAFIDGHLTTKYLKSVYLSEKPLDTLRYTINSQL